MSMKGNRMMKQTTSINYLLVVVALLVSTLVVLVVDAKGGQEAFKATDSSSSSTITSTSSNGKSESRRKEERNNYIPIKCPPNKSLLYQFKTTTLIGNSGISKKGSHRGQSGRSETIISGSIILTCPSKSIRKKALSIDSTISNNNSNKKSNKKNIVLVTFNQVVFSQFRGRTSVNKKYRKLDVKKDLTSDLNKNSFIFTQSDSGHVQNLIFKQSEERYIRSIKKGIIRMLTTETKKRARSQTDGFGGKYHKSYNRNYKIGKITKNRSTLNIYQKFNQDDFITALPVNKRHLHYEGTHIVNISIKKNLIKNSLMKLHFTFGPSKIGNDKHYAFVEFEKLTNSSQKDKLPEQDATSELETLFIGKIQLKQVKNVKLNLNQEIKQTILNLEMNGRTAKLGNEFTFENSFSINKFDKKSMMSLKRREFSSIYFKRLLNGCKQDPSLSRNSNIMLAALAKYSKLHPIKSGDILLNELQIGIKKLNKLSKSNTKSNNNSNNSNNGSDKNSKNIKEERLSLKNYLESIQNLAATIKSQRIQNSLVKLSSMHPYLSHNFIYASIVIPYPTEHSFGLLKSLKTNGLKLKGEYKDEINNQDVKKNAYMAYADLASRIRSVKFQKEIVKEIITRIGESTSLTELTTNFHALNNAGRAVQVEILEVFLRDDRIPDTIKTLIVENLKKRLKDEDELDEMIHSILGSTGYSPTLKSSLINAQTEREKHLRRGQSIPHLVALHRKSKKNEEIKSAIRNYMYICGTEQSGNELAKMLKITKNRPTMKQLYSQSLKKQHASNTLSNLLSEDDLELLDHIHEMDQNVLFRRFFRRLGRAFRRVGAAIRRVARRVGGHLRRIGGRIGSIARRIGRSIGRIAKAVAKGVVKAVNWIKDKLLAAINAVKNIVAKIKYYFSAAKFENQKACMQVSTKADDQMCLYHPGMIEFVRKQGDLSTIKKAKHFSFEKLLGTNAVHMYMGFLVYAGASFECSAEKSGFDFVLLAKANMYAKLFKKELVVIDASAELTKRPDQPINDNVYVKVFQTTFINTNFVPERIRKLIEACFSETKPLVEKRFPKLIDYHYQFSIGPIPVNFNFNVALNMGVELRYGVCVEKLEASASVEPYISLSVTGSANVGVPVAKVGVYLKATITYRIVPRLAFEKCNLCAMLQHKLDGITFDVGLTAAFMSWKKEWKFFRQQTKGYVKTLFEKCIGAGNYKPSDNDSKKLELTSQRSQPTDQPSNADQSSTDQSSQQSSTTESSEQSTQTIEEQQQQAEQAAKNPPGYQTNPPELSNLKSKVDSPEELQRIAQEKGVGNWAKKTSEYKSMFGPKAERIPLSGGKPPSPSKQSLRRPVTIQKVKAWTSEFLREHVPQEVIEKVGIEKLRHLPDEYFHLHLQDRAKIPNEILLVPTEDLKHFIEHLPNRYNKKSDFNPPSTAFTHVWSTEVLQKRLPKVVLDQVEIEYLRNLPEEILQIRVRVLEKIPVSVWKAGNQAIVNWICANYKHLCSRLVKLIKSDTGKDMTPTQQPEQSAQPQQPAQEQPQQQAPQPIVNNNTRPIRQSPVQIREYENTSNSRGGGRKPVFIDVNVNINKKPQ